MKQIALVDWDGSLRKGYHVRDFLKFHADHDYDVNENYDAVNELCNKYENGNMAYTTFVSEVNLAYSTYLEGKQIDNIDKLCFQFSKQDKMLLPTYDIIAFLLENNLDVFVITGSPSHIVRPYLEKAVQLFGTEFQIKNRHYASVITKYFGGALEKENIAKSLLAKYKIHAAELAIGDSESDKPLFDLSRCQVLVNNSKVYLNLDGVNKSIIAINDFSKHGIENIKNLIS